jgi:hypothetical protein
VAVGCVANIPQENGVSILKVKISIITSIQTGGLFQNSKHDTRDSLSASFFLKLFNLINVLNSMCNMTICRNGHLNG